MFLTFKENVCSHYDSGKGAKLIWQTKELHCLSFQVSCLSEEVYWGLAKFDHNTTTCTFYIALAHPTIRPTGKSRDFVIPLQILFNTGKLESISSPIHIVFFFFFFFVLFCFFHFDKF